MSESDMCSHVKVVVRVRPENSKEQEGNFKKVVHVVDKHMLIFDPKEQEVTFFRAQRLRNRDVNKRANKDLKFVFDHVFGEDSSQFEVFENSTKGILDGVLNGYNCTVFAYGATGAGKTHTMLGSENNPGVMYLTMKELFGRIDQVKDEKIFDVAFSYLEIYNEQIRDLLANSGPLAVREDSTKGVVVQGLTLHQPKSAEHILEALDYGNKNRTQHPTDVNASSSRSHAVFQIYLRQQDRTASLNPNVRVAKMSLIDLAGSERASATNTKGARFREGANINRSLLALGNVINTLADPKSKKTHIPYRDSKLTRLLKDSLGGNCRTIMIANVGPSSVSYEDTYNTLKYANRAKEIKSSLKSNVVSLDSHISQYAVICEKQRAEIVALKQKLKEYEERKIDAPDTQYLNPLSIPTKKQADFERMEETLQKIFTSRVQIRKELLNLERQLKENELRQHHKEECHQQIQLLCAEDKAEKATCKHERRLASLLTHRQHLKRRLSEVGHHFLENESWLHRVENEMKLLGQDGQIPKVLQKDLQCHKLQLQVEDLKQQIEHMTHLISLQDQENKQTKKIVSTLLPAYRNQYRTLKDSGLATPIHGSEYQGLEQLVLRERGVVWADQHVDEGCLDTAPSQSELASVLTFSHLICHQSTPCSAEKHKRKSSHSPHVTTLGKDQENKENPPPVLQEAPPKKPTRRKLTISPPHSNSANLALPQYPSGLQEAFRQEGMFPLQYTPEICRVPSTKPPHQPAAHTQTSSDDPNATFEVADSVEPNTGNATIILSPGTSRLDTTGNDNRSFKRSEIPSLLEDRHAKPSYMAMTSAAQSKRKRTCYTFSTQGPSAPKRVKQDSAQTIKPLRVRRFGGPEENMPERRVVRSVSEGNLNLTGVPKPKSTFLKTTQLFKKVTKRL
ncbi:kinesin-like protein KIF18A [Megalops cyprinoides]|uniref:kinesin-like protein KIF18A n=1 Tax=Megalops cyprinoides TaxID=118141 RepID=UPI001864E4CB|nr:kinesin-like protein KIF18A [Megalops cyprinoides]